MRTELKEMLNQREDILLVTSYIRKIEILKEFNQEKKFHRVKFFTKEELLENITYKILPCAMEEVVDVKKVEPSIARLILQNMRAITYKEKINEKCKALEQLEQVLKEKKCIREHSIFLSFIKNKTVLFYGYLESEVSEITHILEWYHIPFFIIKPEVKEKEKIIVTEYETLEEEVVSVAEEITKLIRQGISCNHIYIHTLAEEYMVVLPRIFKMFHIPLQLQESKTIFAYEMIQDFLQHWKNHPEDIQVVLQEIKNRYPLENPIYQKLYQVLVGILDDYVTDTYDFSTIYAVVEFACKNRKMKATKYDNVIEEVDAMETSFTEEDYVFFLGANYGTLPKIYEDDDYLEDFEKQSLHLLTSIEKNECEKQKLLLTWNEISNLFISYKRKSPFKEFLGSLVIEELKENGKVEIQKWEYQYTNRNYNRVLLGKYLDDFIKYNVHHPMLDTLWAYTPISYASYQNQFTGISKEQFYQFMQHTCHLSYTTMDLFFKCQFRFFLYSILKIRAPFKETPSLFIGNVFHSILERVLREDKDKQGIILEEVQKVMQPNLSKKEQFYLKKYQREIWNIIEIIEQQNQKSHFQNTYLEENFVITYPQEMTFHLLGKIDKIMTLQKEDSTYFIVVDYKTGSASNHLNKVIYGLNMQLLLYIYFIFHTTHITNPKFTGAYLQNIVKEVPNKEEGKTLKQLRYENAKWDGISINRVDILKEADEGLEDGSFIAGVRLKKDGDFYQSNKILTEDTLEKLLQIVEKNIHTAMEAISKADFKINPKRFLSDNGEISGCQFCEYRDICYRSPRDIVTLKEYKNLEFLKEES